MQTHIASEHRSNTVGACLHQETDGLEALQRGLAERVAVLQLAHEAAIGRAESILARMDALIARLEAR